MKTTHVISAGQHTRFASRLTVRILPRWNLLARVLRRSTFYGVGVRDREDARQERHDELCLRGVRDRGGVWLEARPASGVLWLRGNGDVLCRDG